jgi:precorrin-6A/cobalt-precorrin-6A reductase
MDRDAGKDRKVAVRAMRVLVLGGSSEAAALARAFVGRPDFAAVLSLAGRTHNPVLPQIRSRVGGFGGVAGLVKYCRGERIDAVVDATHPFAAQMSRHAAEACGELGLPLLVLSRPPWALQPGDRWVEVDDMSDAVAALGETPRTVFLTVGRLSLPSFGVAPQHRYVVRTIDEPEGLDVLPRSTLITARGPFTVEDEMALMVTEGVDILVTKNSGAAATAAKLAAARSLGLPVVMVRRPAGQSGDEVHAVEDALAWLEAHRPAP